MLCWIEIEAVENNCFGKHLSHFSKSSGKNYRNSICHSMRATLASESLAVYEMVQWESHYVEMFNCCWVCIRVCDFPLGAVVLKCVRGPTQGIMVPFNRNLHTCHIDRVEHSTWF